MTYKFDEYGATTDNHVISRNENVYEVYRKGEEETGYPEECFETLDEALRYVCEIETPSYMSTATTPGTNLIKAMEYQKLAEIFQAIENGKGPTNMNIKDFMDYFHILYEKLFDSDVASAAGRDEVFNKLYELEFTISIGKATYKHVWSPATVDGLNTWFKEWGEELLDEEG